MTTFEGQPFKYYAARGYPGYMHAECWPHFEKQHSRYDAQGYCISRPMLWEKLWSLGRDRKKPCIHCNQPLTGQPQSTLSSIGRATDS